jgi:hypothetical protein
VMCIPVTCFEARLQCDSCPKNKNKNDHRCILCLNNARVTHKKSPSMPTPSSHQFFSCLSSEVERTSSLARLKLLNKLLGRLLPIALRVILRPAPQVLTGVLESELGTPAELGVGTGGVGGQVEDITRAARGDFVGEVTADGGGEGFDHLVDGAAFAGAQVPGADAGVVLAEVVERCEVAVGEVEDVDVVTDGSAVLGVVVWKEIL